MRKFLLILAALMLAAPAMATVTVSVIPDPCDANNVLVTYDVNDNDATVGVRAFALSLTAADANITAIGGYKVGESTNAEPGYGIFVGSIQIDGNGEVTDYGDPVAAADDPDGPGQLGSASIIVELGSLYDKNANPSDAPLNSGTLCSLTLDGCSIVTPAADALRGGIVMEDPDVDPCSTVMNAGEPDICAPTCACWGDATGLTPVVPDGAVDLSDLSYMVGYLNPAYAPTFIAPVAPGYECFDLTGLTPGQQDNLIDLSDLSYMVGYLNPAYAPTFIAPCMAAPAPPP
jgi:hypothetical protein